MDRGDRSTTLGAAEYEAPAITEMGGVRQLTQNDDGNQWRDWWCRVDPSWPGCS